MNEEIQHERLRAIVSGHPGSFGGLTVQLVKGDLSLAILNHLPIGNWYGREALDAHFRSRTRRAVTQALKRLERRGLIRWSTSDGKQGYTRLS